MGIGAWSYMHLEIADFSVILTLFCLSMHATLFVCLSCKPAFVLTPAGLVLLSNVRVFWGDWVGKCKNFFLLSAAQWIGFC